MYFKRIILNIAYIAIALTSAAQVGLPVFQNWNKENYPVYVSDIQSLTKGSNKMSREKIAKLEEKYCESNGEFLSNLSKKSIIATDPIVTVVQINKEEHVIIPTLFWNVNHSPKDWLETFQISDFKQEDCEAIAIVEGSISFFVRKNSTTMTMFYYEDLFAFISHNMNKQVSLTEPGIEELIEWIHYVPVKDITENVSSVIKDIKFNVGKFYKLEFESSIFDRQLKNL